MPFNPATEDDKLAFSGFPVFAFNADELCVDPCDEDELDDEADEEHGAIVVVAELLF